MSGFELLDYLFFSASLLVSLLIGVYFSFKKSSQQTTEAYLMGNRQMKFLPVTLSLTVSVMSALTLQGVPVEIYLFGIQFILYCVGVMISAIVCTYTFIPLLHPLNITSVNEYLELRFQSKSVRIFACFMLILIQSSYVGCLMFGPAVSLQIATGLNPFWGLLIINTAGTFYTTFGGIKAVVYTDVFQSIIMVTGIILVIVLGTNAAGGLGNVYNESYEWGRLFVKLSPHPHVRVSLWTTLIGNFFTYYGFWSVNQACTQRFLTMPRLQDAQRSLLVSGVLFMFFHSTCSFIGLILFSYYNQIGCDPIKSGQLNNLNQLLPEFVNSVLNYPVVAGLFISSLVSASLSSLSSSVNSMSAVIWEDLLKNRFYHLSDLKKTLITKVIACSFGVLCTIVSFIVWGIGGNISQVSLMLVGALIGPLLGIHLLGAMIPWSNWIGAFGGGVSSVVIALWMMIGQIFNKTANQPLPTKTDQCDMLINSTFDITDRMNIFINESHISTTSPDILQNDETLLSITEWIYTISFHWYPILSVFITMIVGIIVSLMTGKTDPSTVDKKFLFPFLRNKYGRCEDYDKYDIYIKEKRETCTKM